MLTKVLSGASIGLLLGYLSGYFLSYGGALIRLSFLGLFVSLFFVKNLKRDQYLRALFCFVATFLLFFIFASIRSNILKQDLVKSTRLTSLEVTVKDITLKDNTKVILAEINDEKGERHIKDIKNIVVYSFISEKLYPGDVLHLEGVLSNQLMLMPKKAEESNGVGSFDLMRFWSAKGVEAISMYPKLYKKDQDPVLGLRYYAYVFREKFYLGLAKVMNNENSGILMAMLWGDESHMSRDISTKYRGAGVSHILVLSGYNLAIVAAFAGSIFKSLSMRSRVISSAFLVGLFLLLASTSSPVWRAGLMSLYVFMSTYFLKPANSRLLIWLTAFIFMLYSPEIAVYDISFHMSFLATLSIIYFYPVFKSVLYEHYNIKDKSAQARSLIDVILVTVSANLLIFPYVVYSFGYYNVLGIFVSILVSGLIPLIMLFGFLSGVMSNVSFILAKPFGLLADCGVDAMSFIVSHTHRASISIDLGLFGLGVLLATLYLFFVLLEMYFYIGKRTNKNIDTGNYNIEL